MTIQEKHNFLGSLGFSVISPTLGDKLIVECINKHIVTRPFSKFTESTICKQCSNNKRKEYINNIGFTLISNITDKMLILKCNNNHTFKRDYNTLESCTSCPECSIEKDIKLLKHRIPTLNVIEHNSKSNIVVQCNRNHIYTKSYDTLINTTKVICQQCIDEDKTKFLEQLGYSVVSNSLGDNLEVKCINDHTFKRPFTDFENNTKCPICIDNNKKQIKNKIIQNIGWTHLDDKTYVCENNHIFSRIYGNIIKGAIKCPECEEEIKKTFIASLGFEIMSENTADGLVLKCNDDHIFSRPFSKLSVNSKCSLCYPNISSQEVEIKNFLEELGVEFVHSDWNTISPQELDFYIPKHNLAIEFNGMYWHSEAMGKDKNYHLNKTNKCNDLGITLLHILEDEWNNPIKKEIWKDTIKKHLGFGNNIYYSDNLIIENVPVDVAITFLSINYLSTFCITNEDRLIGLYSDKILLKLVVFREQNDDINIMNVDKCNFCIDGEVLNLIINCYQNCYQNHEIIKYNVDRRNCHFSYLPNSFNLVGYTEPNKYNNVWDCGQIILNKELQ